MRRAVYAGTFDPLTEGHWWLLCEGASLFDELIVAVAHNPTKKGFWFTTDERIGMIQACVATLPDYLRERVKVDTIQEQYLVRYAVSKQAEFILRGLRSASDFGYEHAMRQINGDITKTVVSVYMMPPRELSEIASSTVKSLIGPEGWEQVIQKYLPAPVYEQVVKKVAAGL